jgi:hypothetical protein
VRQELLNRNIDDIISVLTGGNMKINANEEIATLVQDLKNLRALMKQLKNQEETIIGKLGAFMQENDELVTEDGEMLLTWKYTKDIEYFNAKKLLEADEALYNSFLDIRPGHRRLEIK